MKGATRDLFLVTSFKHRLRLSVMVTSYVYGIRVRHRSILRPWQLTFQYIVASLLASEIKYISPHLRSSGRPEHNSKPYEPEQHLLATGFQRLGIRQKCRTLQCGYTMYLFFCRHCATEHDGGWMEATEVASGGSPGCRRKPPERSPFHAETPR